MADVLAIRTGVIPEESSKSATSWGAIAAGGVASAAFTLFLVELVAGLGLVMVSSWSNQGASAATLSVAGGIGLILMAVMASALGGYIAGRLRTRWVGIKTDEVYFRDTAHGLLAWAVGTIILATVLASAAGTMVCSVTQGASSNPALVPDRNSYYVDSLFRSDRPVPANAGRDRSGQRRSLAPVARALTPGIGVHGERPHARRATGRGPHRAVAAGGRAARRSDDRAGEGRGRSGAQGAAKLAFWIAASLLAGALAASLGAIEGGRERDD